MDESTRTAEEVCRKFVETLATRKQPARVVRAALTRITADAPTSRVVGDALGAACVVALGLGVRAPFVDDETAALAPPLRKPESYEDDVVATLELVVAIDDALGDAAIALRDLLVARRAVVDVRDDDADMPLFTSPSPLFVPSDVPPPERATRVGEQLASCAYVVGPFDDAASVTAVLDRTTTRALDDVVDEVFAPIFESVAATSTQAREAYALSGLLALFAGLVPQRIVPSALASRVPRHRHEVTRAALGFARGVLDRLELSSSALRLEAPDADIRGRTRLRIRALRRVIARDRVVPA